MLPRARHGAPALRTCALVLAGACALVLGACGDTVQNRPISNGTLEDLIVAPYTAYWLGASFHGLAITEGYSDPGGAFTLQYGNCLNGGQSICTPPLLLVTSPDNSFVPGGASPAVQRTIRGVTARISESGRTIAIPTGGVVVSIFAQNARLAAAAARTVVPINAPGSPGEALTAARPDTGYGSRPLGSQLPSAPTPEG
jgi:hypothetical protein